MLSLFMSFICLMIFMSDILVLWDKPLLWDRLFQEYGMFSSSALPDALLSSYLPPTKLILIPAGFMSDVYTAAAASFAKEKVVGKLIRFVENGGSLLVFSPKINEPVSFSWLNLPITFVPQNAVLKKKTHLLDQDSFFCDGWFQNMDESCAISEFDESCAIAKSDESCAIAKSDEIYTITESDDKGRPIHLEIQKEGEEKGKIILSSIHEFLSKSYFLSLLNGPKVKI